MEPGFLKRSETNTRGSLRRPRGAPQAPRLWGGGWGGRAGAVLQTPRCRCAIPNMSLAEASDLPNQRGTSAQGRPLARVWCLRLPHGGGKPLGFAEGGRSR